MINLFILIFVFCSLIFILLTILFFYKKLNKKLLNDLFLTNQQNKLLFLKNKKYNIIYYDLIHILYIHKFYTVINNYLNKQIKNKNSIGNLKLQITEIVEKGKELSNQFKIKDQEFKELENNKNNELSKLREEKNYFENLYIVEQSGNQEKNNNEDLFSVNNKKDILFLLDNFNIVIRKIENANNKIKSLLKDNIIFK